MKKIVIAGRNDSGKSTILGEIYRGLKAKDFQPLAIGSGVQDEKPYLLKGINVNYLAIAMPRPGEDVITDVERVIKQAVNQIRERNRLIQHARKALEELNKVRSVLDLGCLTQRDIPPTSSVPDVTLIEAVGTNDGYKSAETKSIADMLVTIVPANIKTEIVVEPGNVLLDDADIIVVTKIDETPRSASTAVIKLLQRIYRHKPIIPVVATDGVHVDLVIEEVMKRLAEPMVLLDMQKSRDIAGKNT